MRLDRVASTPKCAECGEVWLPADETRWRAYRIDDPFDDNEPPAVAFYCPATFEM